DHDSQEPVARSRATIAAGESSDRDTRGVAAGAPTPAALKLASSRSIREQENGQLGEACAGVGFGYEPRRHGDAIEKRAQVRDTDGVWKEREHRRVVGRVAHKKALITNVVERDGERFVHQRPGHRKLVVVAEPAVDMDGALL